MEESDRDEERLSNLLKWGAELGISDPSATEGKASSCLGKTLFVSEFPEAGGRGLGASRDIRKGELVLSVPKSALMTAEALLRTDGVLFGCVATHPCLSPVQVIELCLSRFGERFAFHSDEVVVSQKLIVCLLYEVGKGKDSSWYPYLEALPRSYSTLSAFGKFEMRAFQVDYAVWAAEMARLKVENEWKVARAVMRELRLKPRILTFGSWLWASATVSSRTLHIPWDEAGCLCPVGDLFNYAAPGEGATGSAPFSLVLPSCDHDCDGISANDQSDADLRLTDGGYEEDVASYCFYARKHYRKGEQVLLGYGTYTNLELLEHYGFLLDENPNEKVYIPIKDELLSSSSWPRDSLYIEQSGKPSFALLAALRLWALPPWQRKRIGNLAYSGSPLSIENEARVMSLLATICEEALTSLPTSFEEDCDLIHGLNRFNAITCCTPAEFSDRLAMLGSKESFDFSRGLLQDGDGVAKTISWDKIRLVLGRWRLAIRWRRMYKRTLLDCISFCKERLLS